MLYFILILAHTCSLYLIIALISFNPADPSWMQYTWNNQHIYNLGGIIGARISDFLFFYFGILSYIIPLFILFYTWKFFYKKKIGFLIFFIKILKVSISLLILCVLVQLNVNDIFYFSPGGLIGNVCADFITMNPYKALYIILLVLFCQLKHRISLLNKRFLCFVNKIYKKINHIKYDSFFKNKNKNFFLQKKQLFIDKRISPSIFCIKKNNILKKNCFRSLDINNKFNINSKGCIEFAKKNCVYFKNNLDKPQYISLINNMSDHHNQIFNQCNKFSYHKLHINHHKQNNNCITKYIHKFVLKNNSINYITNMFNKHFKQKQDHIMITSFSQKQLGKNSFLSFNYTKKIGKDSFNVSANQQKLIPMNNLSRKIKMQSIQNNHKNLSNSKINFYKTHDTTQFILPNTNLLMSNLKKNIKPCLEFQKISKLIEKKLLEYRIVAHVAKIVPGPVITRFELNLSAGIKSSKISSLSRDLARSLSVASVQVIEVIPGTPYVGLEIPNTHRCTVYLQDIIRSDQFKNMHSPLALVFGQDIAGQPIIQDLRCMPHLLIAGTTGSGKSVGINVMIISILYTATPEDVRFIMIDPKILELSIYSKIPHLLTTVITDTQDVESILQWCVKEMENRYKLMSIVGVRNLESYNHRIQELSTCHNKSNQSVMLSIEKNINHSACCASQTSKKLPYIIVIIDEFSDLMIMTAKKVEVLIIRLTQKARAAGIHLILSTQRPSVDVITGVIKANIPARLAFTVSSKIDSRTILGQAGAEALLGMGDMLYLPPNSSDLIRIHGAHITDKEIYAVVKFWKNQTFNNKSLYKI